MTSNRMHALAAMLRLRPDLADDIAAHLDQLAECVEQVERACIPPHLTTTRETLPDNVQRIDDPRRDRA